MITALHLWLQWGTLIGVFITLLHLPPMRRRTWYTMVVLFGPFYWVLYLFALAAIRWGGIEPRRGKPHSP